MIIIEASPVEVPQKFAKESTEYAKSNGSLRLTFVVAEQLFSSEASKVYVPYDISPQRPLKTDEVCVKKPVKS